MNAKILAITAIAVIIVAGAGVAIVLTSDNNKDDGKYTFTDNKGNDITLDIPVSGICINNPYIGMDLALYHLTDKVKGITLTGNMFARDETAKAIYKDAADVGSESAPDAAAILKTGCNVFISCGTAINVTNEDSLRDQGITVIFLEGYGDTMMNDLKIVTKILGAENSDSVKEFNNYYNNRMDEIKTKVNALNKGAFDFIMPTTFRGTNFYAGAYSSPVNMMKSICPEARDMMMTLKPEGKSATEDVSSDLVQSKLGDLEYMMVIGYAPGTFYQPATVVGTWLPSLKTSDVYTSGHVYWLNMKLQYGLTDVIACQAMAEMLGATFERASTEEANYLLDTFLPGTTPYTTVTGQLELP